MAAGAITAPWSWPARRPLSPSLPALMKQSPLPYPYPNRIWCWPDYCLVTCKAILELWAGKLWTTWGPHVCFVRPARFKKNKKPQIGCQCLKTRRFHIKIQISGFTLKIWRSGNTGLTFPHDNNWLQLSGGCPFGWAVHTLCAMGPAAVLRPLALWAQAL